MNADFKELSDLIGNVSASLSREIQDLGRRMDDRFDQIQDRLDTQGTKIRAGEKLFLRLDRSNENVSQMIGRRDTQIADLFRELGDLKERCAKLERQQPPPG